MHRALSLSALDAHVERSSCSDQPARRTRSAQKATRVGSDVPVLVRTIVGSRERHVRWTLQATADDIGAKSRSSS